MNIKSLLLGSAAALVAVSGARAADAVDVVAEPEPVEYVRVCDTYGTGYFYIPGTETCLRIGGYVRYEIGGGDLFGHVVNDNLDLLDGKTKANDTYHKRARLSLRTWTGSETELGTLSTYTETRFNRNDDHDGSGTGVSLNFAWIQLGGFRIGKDESAFTTFADYAGGVANDDLIGYGPFDTNLISYTFDAGNGFSAIIALEEGSGSLEVTRFNGTKFDTNHSIDSYMPHVVAGVKYAGGWGSALLVGAYDSNWEEFAIKGRVDVNVSEQVSLFVMGAYGSTDNISNNYFKAWNGDWAVWGGGSLKASDKATVNVQASYTDGGDFITDAQWAVVANVAYTVVPGFVITPEVAYADDGGDGYYGTVIRFQRSF